jgi:hypothetical protein
MLNGTGSFLKVSNLVTSLCFKNGAYEITELMMEMNFFILKNKQILLNYLGKRMILREIQRGNI